MMGFSPKMHRSWICLFEKEALPLLLMLCMYNYVLNVASRCPCVGGLGAFELLYIFDKPTIKIIEQEKLLSSISRVF